MPLQVSTTWELLLLTSFATCPPLIREYLKLGLQATFVTWHSPNGEDPLHSWLTTSQALIGGFLRNLQDKSSFSL